MEEVAFKLRSESAKEVTEKGGRERKETKTEDCDFDVAHVPG